MPPLQRLWCTDDCIMPEMETEGVPEPRVSDSFLTTSGWLMEKRRTTPILVEARVNNKILLAVPI